MGRAAAGSREVLERLAAAGLELHLQVVLCPGWNDGDVLAETVALAGELEAVADLGIVPVSLAAEGELRRLTADDAAAVIAAVAGWQRGFLRRRGSAFVHAADEFYLLAGADPPPGDAAGAVRERRRHLGGAARGGEGWADSREAGRSRDVNACRRAASAACACSRALARPVLERAAAILAAAFGVPVRPLAVKNRLFGPHITVTGLLGGAEVIDALATDPLADGEWLVAPRVFLPADLGRTLDDVRRTT